MKRLIFNRLAGGFAAVLAVAAVPAAANDMANPAGFSYYGYGGSSFGYGGVDAAPGVQTPGYAAPGATAWGAAPQFTTYAGYGGYPYGYSGYGPNHGYAGYGYGYASGGYGGYGRRPHHCSFGGNCPCCNNVWDGYGGGDCGYGGGCCAGPTKVHRRHRPLGFGAGPCVDASCGAYGSYGRPHRCHRRWQQGSGCGPTGCYGGYAPAGMTFEPAPVQNVPRLPATEQVQPPMPGIDSEAPPSPEPTDNSST